MAYEIRIRGHKEPMVVEKNAERLKADWQEFLTTKKDKIVDVDGWTGRLSMILDFQTVRSSEANKEFDSHKEYMNERKKILSISLEDRAKRMNWFRLVYFSFTKQKSEDISFPNGKPIEELAKAIQLKFFIEHPKRTVCEIELFRPLIKSNKTNKWVVPTLEEILRQDRFAEKNRL